jgi:hypothetical protein
MNCRLNAISQAHLKIGVDKLNEILVTVTNEDAQFVKWLKDNGYDDIVTKNPGVKQSSWSKQEFAAFPWYDQKGKLKVKEETIKRLENILK